FKRTRQTLAVIRDAIRRHGTGYLYFISVVQRKNLHQMRAIVELAREFDVVEVQFHIIRGFEEEALKLDDRLARASAGAVDAALELGVTVTFNVPAFTRGLDADKVRRAGTLAPRPLAPSTFLGAPGAESMRRGEGRLRDAYRVSVHQRCFKPF